ncbi:MAG: hypothetical protein K0Q73_9200 [Paenibacillus sp.]|jgi:hypothetical protein|nr:hypothetical protein [Paenibacillus sp.]
MAACNVGRTEQVIRISIGILILVAGLAFESWWGLIGIAPILTGLTRYCPANALLGINNCQKVK